MTYLPESKLNRIMLTHSKDEWIGQTISLCQLHYYKLTESQFNKLCKSNSNPSSSAYFMLRNRQAALEWVKNIIENDKTGTPNEVAYNMAVYGYVDEDWYEKVAGRKLFPYI